MKHYFSKGTRLIETPPNAVNQETARLAAENIRANQ
jgi:hypothetical protein